MSNSRTVSTVSELTDAVAAGVRDIEIAATLTGMPMLTLAPGVRLRGGTLQFGAKGICLTRDNLLDGVTVLTADDEVAILNDTTVADLGTLTLRAVTTSGQVQLLAQDSVRRGHVRVEGLRVDRADLRGRAARPHAFGVDALQGAFTLWNRQPDPAAVITAELLDIAAGSAETPIRGSGVFVGGHSDRSGTAVGGTVRVSALRTGEIHVDGGIPTGTPDLISGGVFVITGATVQNVTCAGPVTTYGQNDMVLDNWGAVDVWTVTAPAISHGPSGIGFVNFGRLDRLDVLAPIETFGTGARGFNLYDGSMRHARFQSIATHGNGSIGVQISKPLPTLEITGDLTTAGGEGMSLVKGVQVRLTAIALSIKPGGEVGEVTVGGRIATTGDGVVTVEIEGTLGHIAVQGGISAAGAGSDALHMRTEPRGLDAIEVKAVHGTAVIRTG